MKNCFLRRTRLVRNLALFLVSALCILSCIQVGGTAAADQKAKAQDNTVTFEDYEHDALTLMLITTEPIAADGIRAELTLHVETEEKMSLPPASTATETEAPTTDEADSAPESNTEPEQTTDTKEPETQMQQEEPQNTNTDAEIESPEPEENDLPVAEPENTEPQQSPEDPEKNVPEQPEDDISDNNEAGLLSGDSLLELTGASYGRNNNEKTYIPKDIYLDTTDLAPNCQYINTAKYYRTVYTLDGLRGATFTVTLRVNGPDSYFVSSTISSSIDADDNSIYSSSNGDSATDSLATFTITTLKQQAQKNQTKTEDFSLRDIIGTDAYTFGIIANSVTIGADTEANLATDELKPNSHTVGPTYADIALPIYAKKISDNSGNLQLHSNVSAVYTGEKFEIDSRNSGIYHSVDGKKQITNVDSKTLIMQSENYVNVKSMLSSISFSFDAYHEMSDSTGVSVSFEDMNNSIIDTSKSSDNPAIVNVTTANLNNVQSGGLKITTAPGQTIIINVSGSGNLYMREYRINGINSAKSDDGSYADNIIWNFSSAYTGNISFWAGGCGTFVAPNATATIHATSSGRIYVNSFSNPGGEWHSFYTPEDPDEPETESTEPTSKETLKPTETEPVQTEATSEDTSTSLETSSEEESSDPSETSSEEITEPTETSSEDITEPVETSSEDVSDPTEPLSGEAPEPTETSFEEESDPVETSSEEPSDPTPTSFEEPTEPAQTPSETATEPIQPEPEETTEPETETTSERIPEPTTPSDPPKSTPRTPTDVKREMPPADPFAPADPPDMVMLLSSDDDLIALNAAPDMLLSSDDAIPLNAPKTGDESNPILSLCTLFASAFILVFLLFRRKSSSLEDDSDM